MVRIAVLSMLLLCPPASWGETIHVPGDYPTIQQALDAAFDGDTVLVGPGTYPENLDFKGKAVRVQSTDGPAATIIDGQKTGSAVIFHGGEGLDAVLEGFTVRNGSGTFDPAAGFARGGGIYCKGASPTITGNVICYNLAEKGGGLCAAFVSCPSVRNNVIEKNSAVSMTGEALGGGIAVSFSSSPEIRENVIRENTADGKAGWGYGGGIALAYDCAPVIADNTIAENHVKGASSSVGGGVFAVYDCKGLIQYNGITGNTSEAYGGGISLYANCSTSIRGNAVCGNSAGASSGGIDCYYYCSPYIEGNLIRDNQAAGYGGGILCESFCLPVITNNIITKNTAKYSAGIDCSVLSEAIITNNTVWGNTAAKWGGGLLLEGGAATVTNTIFWNNQAPLGAEICIKPIALPAADGVLAVRHTAIEGGLSAVHLEPGGRLVTGPGLVFTDPLFMDPAAGDLHLRHHSPCLDGGTAGAAGLPDHDFEGDPRQAYGAVDIGADEFHPHLYCTGDAVPGGAVEIRFVGLPGTAPVKLLYGLGTFDPPLPSKWGDWHLTFPFWSLALDSIPAGGVEVLPVTLPPAPPGPYAVPMQALIGDGLSNLCVLQVE